MALLLAAALPGVAYPDEAPPKVVVAYAWGDVVATEAAAHLADQLGEVEALKTSTSGLDATRLLERARAQWPKALVVAIDSAARRVSVLRVQDGTVLSRVLDEATARQAPYAVAVAATELIELSVEPSARARPPGVVGQAPWVRLSFAADAGVSASLAREGAIMQPSFGVSLGLHSPTRGWFGTIGATGRVLGESKRAWRMLSLDYKRSDIAAAASVGWSLSNLDVFVTGEVGVSLSDTMATDMGGAEVGREERTSPIAGASLGLRYTFGLGLALELRGGGVAVFQPARFLVEDEVALEEGRFRGHLGLMLRWASGGR